MFLPLVLFSQSCGIYSFSGASIPPNMKTVSVQLIENDAPMVVPYLSNQLTEKLKERIRNQSKLSMVTNNGDGNFEGRITDYSIKPVAVEGTTGNAPPRAGLNRLSITVSVKFTNTLDPKLSYEQSFTEYTEFSLNNGPIPTQEPKLIPLVTDKLTEDIFNRAFANW